MMSDERLDPVVAGHRFLDTLQRAAHGPPEREAGQREHECRRTGVGATADLRHPLEGGIGVAEIVEPEAQRARDPRIPAPLPDRSHTRRDAGIRRDQPLDQFLPAQRVIAIGREVDRVATFGQPCDDRVEVAEVGEVPCDKQDLHGCAVGDGVSSPACMPTGSSARRSAAANCPAPRR